MKVIFLDIDGVLNTTNTFRLRKEEYKKTGKYRLAIDEYRVEYLKRIIDESGAKIVLTSAWRRSFKKEMTRIVSLDEKAQKLQNLFSKYDIEIYDITSVDSFDINREKQIKEWLERKDNIETYIIIDDELCIYKDLTDRVIKNKFMNSNIEDETGLGLGENHIEIAINLLNKRSKILIK